MLGGRFFFIVEARIYSSLELSLKISDSIRIWPFFNVLEEAFFVDTFRQFNDIADHNGSVSFCEMTIFDLWATVCAYICLFYEDVSKFSKYFSISWCFFTAIQISENRRKQECTTQCNNVQKTLGDEQRTMNNAHFVHCSFLPYVFSALLLLLNMRLFSCIFIDLYCSKLPSTDSKVLLRNVLVK